MGLHQEDASGGGGGGMSRAAKKRLKKKQKQKQQKQKQQQQQQKKRKTSADALPVDNNQGEKRNEKKAKLELFEDSDDFSDDGNAEAHLSYGDGADQKIADISRQELEFLQSQGVTVTTEEDKKKAKKKKKKQKSKKAKRQKSTKDVPVEYDSDHKDSDGTEDDDTEEEIQEKEILQMIAQSLTPTDILFPESAGDDEEEEEEKEEEDGGDSNGKCMDSEVLQAAASDPRRILQDLTSTSRAHVLFESLLAPSGVTVAEFYRDYWEKKPLLISKPKVTFANTENGGGTMSTLQHKARLDGILSKKDIENMLANCSLRYGREINVTRYADTGDGTGTKRRITLDLPPKPIKKKGSSGATGEDGDVQHIVADPKDVWSNFSSGCTVRLLCPHLHSDSVHSLLSTLELEFGCMVGSNAYLTPGGDSQGFAPHYDDIEAFILQLEGRKRWLVYPPPNKAETLPRFSSRDYTEKEMEGTSPVIDTVLCPGDVLYMPRGWIHQAHTPPSKRDGDVHSLHLTASAMQQWSWIDFLSIIMPEALDSAAASETSTSLREGLPRNFLNYMGAMYDTNGDDTPESLRQADEPEDEGQREELMRQRKIQQMQDKFCAEANKRIMRVCREAMSMVNAGCDQIGKRFLSDRQPPALMPNEAILTSEHRAENGGKIWPNTLCRLSRPGIARLVLEDGKAVLYHCADNSRVFHGTPLSPLEFEVDDAPALEMLLTTTEPHWICVKDLIHGDIEDKMEIAQSLYDEGILAIYQDETPDRTVQTG